MRAIPFKRWFTAWAVAGLSTPVALTATLGGGFYHSAVLQDNGTVVSFGGNTQGQMGNSTRGSTDVPTPVQALITGVRSLSVGDAALFTLALKSDGTVWVWGSNSDGQLGDGTTTSSAEPKQVSGLTGVTAVAAGQNFALALKSDGSVWAWGANGYGQVGIGNTTNSSTNNWVPRQVSGLSGVTAIAACYEHALAVKSDGSVWAWGDNNAGELGLGSTGSRQTSPVQVSAISSVTQVACGSKHSVALKTDGSVWAWGNNFDYQLGDGTQVAQSVPKQVAGVSGATQIAASENTTLALLSAGTVMGWGATERGQVGVGQLPSNQNQYYKTPTAVSALSGVTEVARGYHHSLARKSDGSVFTWGWNDDAQLGNASTTTSHTPVQVVSTLGVGQLNAAASEFGGMALSAMPSGTLSSLNGLLVYFSPATADKGSARKLYLAAQTADGSLFIRSGGAWSLYAGGSIGAYSSVSAMATSYIGLIGGGGVVDPGSLPANLSSLAGIRIILGYGSSAEDMLANGRISSFTLR